MNIWLLLLRCFSSLTTITAQFYFPTIKMKYLTTVSTLFFFTDYNHYAVLLHYYWMKISDYTHYAVLLSLQLKWNLSLHSLRCCSSLTTLTTLFYFTTIKMKYLTMLTTFFFSHYTNYTVTSLLLNWNVWLR